MLLWYLTSGREVLRETVYRYLTLMSKKLQPAFLIKEIVYSETVKIEKFLVVVLNWLTYSLTD